MPPVCKGLLKAAISLSGKWIAAWGHAALAGIDARKAHRAQLKLDDRAGFIEQPIFSEGRDATDLYIGSQAKAQVVGINAREPGAHLSERGCTDDSIKMGFAIALPILCLLGSAAPQTPQSKDQISQITQ